VPPGPALGVGDEYRGARSGTPQSKGKRRSGRGDGGGRGWGGEEAEWGLCCGVDTSPSSKTALTCVTKSWCDVRCRARQVQMRE
jgi:hypothetical protein